MMLRCCLLFLALIPAGRSYCSEGDSSLYRRILIQQCTYKVTAKQVKDTAIIFKVAQVPHYQIPKGNIFCRMEDYLSRRTGVWIKVGVWSQQK
jgi:hypothetical protein